MKSEIIRIFGDHNGRCGLGRELGDRVIISNMGVLAVFHLDQDVLCVCTLDNDVDLKIVFAVL